MQLKLGVRVVDGVSIVDCRGRLLFGDEAGALRDTVKNLLAEARSRSLSILAIAPISIAAAWARWWDSIRRLRMAAGW